MGDLILNLNESSNEDCPKCYIQLMKDQKIICRTKCFNVSIQVPKIWNISDIVRLKAKDLLDGLPQFFLFSAPENAQQEKEWGLFLGFLHKTQKVAIAQIELCKFYIHPPAEDFSHIVVSYRMQEKHDVCNAVLAIEEFSSEKPARKSIQVHMDHGLTLAPRLHMTRYKCMDKHELTKYCIEQNCALERNYVRANPSYLKTLGQAHSGWIFGAVAELIDNSRDAKATKLEISIEKIFSKIAGKDIPMLSVIDDGHGMTHEDIVRMVTFGHEQPDLNDPDYIGRFGVGFKTGAMRLGNDALVLTQASNSRSIAFLSQSLNQGKNNLEIPIVSYCRRGQFMEVDMDVQTEALAKYNLNSIKKFSPFNEYLIGEKAALFCAKGTGTQIYIWNLEEWGSEYCLEWDSGMSGGSSFHQGDICIRSRRIRSRPGQMSRRVPLDYSLRSYIEVIFLDPRMKTYVQGSLVRSRPLAKSLNRTVVEKGFIMGKQVQLTLGRCQLEREQGNSGIFLYWHGRLIEAYKRVGSMIHNGDMSHGIIGVIDVTNIMDDGNGHVWVHSNKQGFQDCEVYALLEDWLGQKADEYLDNNCDKLQLRKSNALYKPDYEWVQCDKCRKWRMLDPGFDCKTLPQEWFCYMKPFTGSCEIPEQKADRGVITISTKRSGYVDEEDDMNPADWLLEKSNCRLESCSEDDSSQTVEDNVKLQFMKRLRTGPPRSCKKGT